MWLVRLRIRYARPWARGRNRFMVGPSSTYAAWTTSSRSSNASEAWSAFTRAFATALSSTLRTGSLAACGANCSTALACVASLPRMRSTTRRAFWGVTRAYRACALASIAVPCLLVANRAASAAAALPVVLLVPAERAGGSELTELVSDHGLGHEDRHVLAAVVHGDRVAEHVRHDHRAPGPGLDDVLGPLLVLNVHLLLQVVVDEGALLQTARHVSGLLSALLAGTTATHDELVAVLVGAAGPALRLAPGAHRVTATAGLALTTAVRVVDGVHGDTADGGALALPPHAAGLAPVDVRLLGVADLADRGAAAQVDVADLTGRHAQLRVRAVLGDQLHAGARRAGDLRAAPGPQLDGVHDGAGGDVAQRQVVAGLDVRRRAVLDDVALLQPRRGEDVALLAVRVVQQRDPRRAVRVVLDVRDLRRHAVLVVTTEVDDPVGALVAATNVPRGDAARGVAPTGLRQRADQRLLRLRARDLDEVGDARAAAARRRRLVLTNTHGSWSSAVLWPGQETGPPKMSMVPSLSVTTARLVSLRLPIPKRVRRVLPLRLRVLTDFTLTPKTRSTAMRISVLLARGSTRKV